MPIVYVKHNIFHKKSQYMIFHVLFIDSLIGVFIDSLICTIYSCCQASGKLSHENARHMAHYEPRHDGEEQYFSNFNKNHFCITFTEENLPRNICTYYIDSILK